ncbi:MAG: adenylate kinase family protein [Candidatus Methylacidiphilales bacterium]|nr:nucleoside monophosphate kinase [Candidatus Methylacidiphilales bacterium]
MHYRAFVIYGSPGSGKGTQGRVLGTIPGFYHLSTGDVFRSLDFRTEIARTFLEYSSKGHLVPDELTFQVFTQHIDKMIALGTYKPEVDHLILDGIPRNAAQAILLRNYVEVRRFFLLEAPDRESLIARLAKRALKEHRIDDANEHVIRERIRVFDKETEEILKNYPSEIMHRIDASQYPYEVLRDILIHINTRET